VLEVLHVPEERIVVVANHRDGHGVPELERTQVESFLKCRVAAEMPFDAHVIGGSVSHGVPFVVSGQSSEPLAALHRIAHALGLEPNEATPAAAPSAAEPDRRKKGRRRLAFSR